MYIQGLYNITMLYTACFQAAYVPQALTWFGRYVLTYMKSCLLQTSLSNRFYDVMSCKSKYFCHYGDVRMGAIASQITSLTIVYSAFYLGADQRKHQSSASLVFVRGIHRGPVNSPHKGPVTRKMFPFDDVIMVPLLSDKGSHGCDYLSLIHKSTHGFCVLLSGVPDYFGRNKISSGGDLSHYSSASLY